jgi:3'(2'), 5'-bisphosphate nucleotidase
MTPLCELLERIALEAGAAILEVYDHGPNISYKDDHSPVTEADERAEEIILGCLASAFPSIPAVAEEAVSSGHVPDIRNGSFFLVDPLDGTKEFINRRHDFTVNIALIEGGVPIAGIVYAPAQRCAYVADGGRSEKLLIGHGHDIEQRQAIRVRAPGTGLTGIVSRSHDNSATEAFLVEHRITEYASVGSSLKFCMLAEGKADVYPRFGRTMEWDTAAGDAVLSCAGGSVVRLDGSRLLYGKTGQSEDSDFANPHFVAWGGMAAAPATLV